MAFLKKSIRTWMDHSDSLIFSRIAVNGTKIVQIQCVLQSDGSLLIGGIIYFQNERDHSKGYGSLMMTEFLRYTSQIGLCTVYGKLSVVDEGHKDRLHAFYKKHGFEIIEYNVPINCLYREVVKTL